MVRVAVALLLLLVLPASSALAQKRVALLIGNKDYKPGVGALVNPLNDVRVIGEALKAIGFEVLKPVHNARRIDMLLAVHDFAAKLKAAGADAVGFLYYSGHGIASAGENYLIPVDVEEPSTRLLSVAGVKQSEVLAILRGEAPNTAHYFVLDACRNTLQGTRGGKGFVPVGQQSGVLVAFAAEPGKTASDVGQGSGPYAAALAIELVKPGQNDLLMFHNIRVAVIQKTGGDQVPWTEDGIQRPQRVLFGGESKQILGPPTQPQPVLRSEAAEAWGAIKDTTSITVLEAFLVRYKNTFFADLARARIEELKKQIALATPPTSTIPAPTSAATRPKDPNNSIVATNKEPQSPEMIDARLQALPLWRIVKQEFSDWYGERLKEVASMAAQSKDRAEIDQHLTRALVALRRKNVEHALAAGAPQVKAIARTFYESLAQLRKHSVEACHAFISQGEVSPVVIPLMQNPTYATVLQAQMTTVFEAIADGRKTPRIYPAPRQTDYHVLSTDLIKRGWTNADLSVFSDATALKKAPPEKTCQLVYDWFAAQLEIKDADMQLRLLVETIKPVVSG